MTEREAKYTELLSEYLEDNNLPDIFEEYEQRITGISALFIGRYLDREIGFETEVLFVAKLEYTAALWFPVYAQRIEDLVNLIGKWENAARTRSKLGQIKHTYGEQNGSNYNLPANAALPLNPSTTAPTTATHAAQHIDTEEYPEYAEVESGYNVTEYDAHIEALEKEVINMKEKLLDKFERLFMQVY